MRVSKYRGLSKITKKDGYIYNLLSTLSTQVTSVEIKTTVFTENYLLTNAKDYIFTLSFSPRTNRAWGGECLKTLNNPYKYRKLIAQHIKKKEQRIL